jgi:hypothetical protein
MDAAGKDAFYFPVTDFEPARSRQSGKDGVLQFHHVTSRFHEFGGECWHWLWFKWGTCSAPDFDCRFYLNGKLVYSVGFRSLEQNADLQLGNGAPWRIVVEGWPYLTVQVVSAMRLGAGVPWKNACTADCKN